jgi:hypothetical protein
MTLVIVDGTRYTCSTNMKHRTIRTILKNDTHTNYTVLLIICYLIYNLRVVVVHIHTYMYVHVHENVLCKESIIIIYNLTYVCD